MPVSRQVGPVEAVTVGPVAAVIPTRFHGRARLRASRPTRGGAREGAGREVADLRRGRRRLGASPDRRHGEVEETRRWIEFIAKLDPLTSPPTLPTAPEESADVLQPFLPEGWSAEDPELRYNPNRGHPQQYRQGW